MEAHGPEIVGLLQIRYGLELLDTGDELARPLRPQRLTALADSS